MLNDDDTARGVSTVRRANAPRHDCSWWEVHYRAWRGSDKTKAQFCEERGLNINSFDNWCRKLRADGAKKKTNASGTNFVRAHVVSSHSSAKVTLSVGDVSVRFEIEVEADELGPWIQALRQSQC
jgi:hypothetical protein